MNLTTVFTGIGSCATLVGVALAYIKLKHEPGNAANSLRTIESRIGSWCRDYLPSFVVLISAVYSIVLVFAQSTPLSRLDVLLIAIDVSNIAFWVMLVFLMRVVRVIGALAEFDGSVTKILAKVTEVLGSNYAP